MRNKEKKSFITRAGASANFKAIASIGASLIALCAINGAGCNGENIREFDLSQRYTNSRAYKIVEQNKGTNDYLSFFFSTKEKKLNLDKTYLIKNGPNNVERYCSPRNEEGRAASIVIYDNAKALHTNNFYIATSKDKLPAILEDFSGFGPKREIIETYGDGTANVVVPLRNGVLPTKAVVHYNGRL